MKLNSPTWMYFRESLEAADSIAVLLERGLPSFENSLVNLIGKTSRGLNKIWFSLKHINYKSLLVNSLKNLPYGLLFIYLGFLGVLMLASYTEKSDGMRIVSILTGSMSPVIKPGSLILTEPQNDYEVGDIVTYRVVAKDTGVILSSTLTHRIVRIEENGDNKLFVLKGDANEIPDPVEVEKEHILGKVVFNIAHLGYIYSAIRTPHGFIGFVGLPFMVLVKDQAGALLLELKKKDKHLSDLITDR